MKECIDEFSAGVNRLGIGKLHRVAVHFFGPDSELLPLAESFVASALDLLDFPLLAYEIRAYALSPVVSRRVEASHSEISGYIKKSSRRSIPWLGAKLRRSEAKSHLMSHNFMTWLAQEWCRRDVIRQALKCVIPWRQLSAMPFAMVVGWWYQGHQASHYRDLQEKADALKPWVPVAKAVAIPPVAVVTDGQRLLLNYTRSTWSDDVLMSAPAALLERVLPTSFSSLIAGGLRNSLKMATMASTT